MPSNSYRNKSLLTDAENKQNKIKTLLNKLRKYNPAKLKNIKAKEKTLNAAEKLLNNRQEAIDAFKTGIYPYIDGFQIKESEEELKEESKDDLQKFIEYIKNESKGINYDLFKNYINFIVPRALVKQLYKTKNKNKNNALVEQIKKRWSNLKDEAEKISDDEKEIEQPDRILKIVKEILDLIKRLKNNEVQV